MLSSLVLSSVVNDDLVLSMMTVVACTAGRIPPFLVLSMMTVVACTAGQLCHCMCNASKGGGACYGA